MGDKGTLNFSGIVGNSQESVLTINRKGLLDFYPLFKHFFQKIDIDSYGHVDKSRWEIDSETVKVKFNLEDEFFRIFLGRYNPKYFADFLYGNLEDKHDYQNEVLIKRLNDFDKFNRRAYLHNLGKHFSIEPFADDGENITEVVKNIESILNPDFGRGKISWKDQDKFNYVMRQSNEKYSLKGVENRSITLPHKKRFMNKVINKLGESLNRPLFFVSDSAGPDLDCFSLIKCYNEIPTDHLKLVRK